VIVPSASIDGADITDREQGMRIDTDKIIELFGSGWVGVAILIATLAIAFYVILKPA
jgi:hypothetical protein